MKTITLSTAASALSRYWAIHEPYAQQEVARLEAMGPYKPSSTAERKSYQMEGSTAIIPITGVMMKRPGPCMGIEGCTIGMRQMTRLAVQDPDVSSIVFLIDSPGGEVSGMWEFADDIAAAGKVKRTVAFGDGYMLSAAYLAGSQCNEVYATETSQVGSIGIVGAVVDSSRAADMEGVKVIVLASSDLKGAGMPGTVVTEDQVAELRKEVDGFYSKFVASVNKGRDKDLSALATAQVFFAEEAVANGLIDGIRTFDQVISTLAQPVYKPTVFAFSSTYNPPAAAPAKENPNMSKATLTRMMAFFGTNPEALLAAGLTQPDLQAIDLSVFEQATPLDPAIQSRMDALTGANVTSWASAEFNQLLTDRKVTPAMRAGFMAACRAALREDGKGAYAISEHGDVVPGESVKAVLGAFAEIKPQFALGERIPVQAENNATQPEDTSVTAYEASARRASGSKEAN